ncbi:MAG: extracellular solute-binding protein [Treponema sp.]|jgi:putative aldouronate transport system substrate-binding protein|nr:extracellular solute-binding protein [Treponema sp.]
MKSVSKIGCARRAALVLSAALLVSACAPKGRTQETGGITLRVFQYELENQQMDFPNLWFNVELEKKTGIHIEWEPVKDADWRTRLNLMFASADLPDIIRGDVDVEEYGVTQGLLVELDDLLRENMPTYYSRLFMNDADKAIPASNGKMYWIGSLIAQNINHDGNHYINKAWLDKLGLPIPTTIDELTRTLIAFRDRDPNGNGQKDEIPFSAADLIHQTQGVYTHFANFGVPLQRFVYAGIDDNDRIVFPGYMEGFRPALEWLSMCYREGLLDMESITQDSNAWGTKMNAGLVGYTSYLRLINTALTPDIALQYVSILPPASPYGVSVPRLLEVPTVSAVLTVANKHIPESLRWLDAQFETETMMVAYNGPLQPGGPIEPTMKINDTGKYEILYVPENNLLYKYVPVYHAMFFAPGDYYFDIYEMPPHRVERFNSSKQYEEAGVLESKSFTYLQRLVKPNADDALEIARLFTEIEKLMQESIASFIRGGVTDAGWQTFLNSCRAVGVERYIELYQKAWDAYRTAK